MKATIPPAAHRSGGILAAILMNDGKKKSMAAPFKIVLTHNQTTAAPFKIVLHHNQTTAAPFKIVLTHNQTNPPYHIHSQQDESNIEGADIQPHAHGEQDKIPTEVRKVENSQNPSLTASETPTQSETGLGYTLLEGHDILPTEATNNISSYPMAQQMFLYNMPQPFNIYTEEAAKKLAYEHSSAVISVNKLYTEENIKTQGQRDRSLIEIEKTRNKAIIDVNKKILLDHEEYVHTKNMNGLNANSVVGASTVKASEPMKRYISDFIYDVQLVALTIKFYIKSDFYCLDPSSGIKTGHAPIDEKSLENWFALFLRNVVGEEANSYKFSELFSILKELTPILGDDNCDLKSLTEEDQIFKNGIYNVREGSFYQFNKDDRLFGLFPINIDFVHHDVEVFPFTEFDEMLSDIFDDDMNKVYLFYQIAGAIMSNVSLKNIFVFQGISGSGKTALTDILYEMVGAKKCMMLLDLSDLNNCKPEELNACKLVVVQDAADKAITAKQLSLLKNFADGSQHNGLRNFKVLINTNNSVYSSKDSDSGIKFLSNALAKRLVVLPFEKVMDRSTSKVDDKEYIRKRFCNERAHIISTAFKAFSHYYDKYENDRPACQFCYEFPVNAVIDDEVEIV